LEILIVPNAEMRIGLILSESTDGNLKAIMNSIDQGVEIPMTEASLNGDTLLVRHNGAGKVVKP